MRQRRKKKARAKTTSFRSKFEESVALALKSAGVAFSYESLRLAYSRPSTYTPDFVLPNGIILEAKGYWESADRTKHLLVRECHPELDIRFVFQNAAVRLSKKSKTSYGDWCDKHKFLWCDKQIPRKWLNL